MYSKYHFIISVVIGWLTVGGSGLPVDDVGFLVGYAAVIGVGIDLDHFLIARWNTGEWRAVRFCLRRPTVVVVDQSRIFREGEVRSRQRLLSHGVVTIVLVVGAGAFDEVVMLVTATVLIGHILTDVVWDVHQALAARS